MMITCFFTGNLKNRKDFEMQVYLIKLKRPICEKNDDSAIQTGLTWFVSFLTKFLTKVILLVVLKQSTMRHRFGIQTL